MILPTANIFVLGLDETNLETLRELPGDFAFHSLLDMDHLMDHENLDLPALLREANEQLDAFAGTVDAIVGYWDFPVSSMVPLLCEQRDLRSGNLRGVVACEHKYWSRLEQQKAINDLPQFAIMDLDEHDELPAELTFPVWLKPVKSASSELAFLVENHDELVEAMNEMRAGIDKFGEPFEFVMSQIDLPPEVAEVGAMACLAEEAVEGRQVTVEGYELDGEIKIYGVVDSLLYPDSPSFLRYQYPSALPETVLRRMVHTSQTVIDQIRLTCSTFNIEYFWNPDDDTLRLLEINPRHSQSHARLFEEVDGVANHQIMIELALGREPSVFHGKGRSGAAAKWFLRRFVDAVVTRSPTQDEIERSEKAIGGVTVDLVAREGDRLSELAQQDSYSFELAQIFVGGDDERDLIDKYERCVQMLPYEFDDIKE